MKIVKKIKSVKLKKWQMALLTTAFALCIWYAMCLPNPLFNDPTSTVIDDAQGELLGAKIAGDGQWRFPQSSEVPDKFAKSIVAFEDKRFYYHPGVDILAIGRAMLRNIKAGKIKEGGSTISMQVVRLARKNKERTIKEKLIEAVLATRLEIKYSKKKLLAIYTSHAPFGGNVVGLDAAAWRYFGRNAEELSWAEAATLAVLPNSPAMIHPGRNRRELLRKRNMLLAMLQEKMYISEQDRLLAEQEPLPENPLPLPQAAPHLLDKAEKMYKGQRIRTTIYESIQTRASDIVNRHISIFRSNKINNAAALIIDIEANQVIAYVGNVTDNSDKENGASVDIITSARSTGSVLKPLLYAAMIDEGEILPNMLVPDFPLYMSGFAPSNYNKTFDGAVPAKAALARSLNVPAVRMLHQHGIEKFHRQLQQLGMTTINKPASHYGLSLILGGAEGTLWDITAIYAYMARTLSHHSVHFEYYDLNDLLKPTWTQAEFSKQPIKQKHGLLSAAAIWQTMEALSEVNRPEEEATWKSFSSGRKVAWKTGTSYGNRDAWAVGVTPRYAIGVWVGNASGEGRTMLTGVNFAAPILFDLFGLLPHSNSWFKRPYEETVYVPICKHSGHRASELCPQTDSLWIAERGQQSPICPYHMLVHLDKTQRYRVNSGCYPVSQMVAKSFFILPPAQEWYYRRNHPDYEMLPPLMAGCQSSDEYKPIAIIYPSANITVVVPKQMDGRVGSCIFQAAHSDPDAQIFWHIDNKYVGTTTRLHNLAINPSAGKHILYLIDNQGNSITSPFIVENSTE